MKDRFDRNIDYMRISITDRCNLRCRYCMPEERIEKVPMSRILTYEDILRVCEASVSIGINKFKITGGEPLVRKGCADLCKEIKQIPGVQQVTLTTNGQLLEDNISALIDADIDGINISLDSMNADRYRMITGGGDLQRTLRGIDASITSGIKTKINCLIQRQFNEEELIDFASMAFGRGIDVRFIEIMPIGYGTPDTGVSNDSLLADLRVRWPELGKDKTVHGNGPSEYYKLPDLPGAIGLISPMNSKFCDRCNRIRLTSQGLIKPCLCYEDSIDIRPALEDGGEDALQRAIAEAVNAKPSGHSFEKRNLVERRSMVEIGG